MSLSDDLYRIAKSKPNVLDIRKDWQDLVRNHIVQNIKDPHDLDLDTVALIRRCKIHWYKTKQKLEAEGVQLFGEKEIRSFENWIYKEPMFKGIEYGLLAKLR